MEDVMQPEALSPMQRHGVNLPDELTALREHAKGGIVVASGVYNTNAMLASR